MADTSPQSPSSSGGTHVKKTTAGPMKGNIPKVDPPISDKVNNVIKNLKERGSSHCKQSTDTSPQTTN